MIIMQGLSLTKVHFKILYICRRLDHMEKKEKKHCDIIKFGDKYVDIAYSLWEIVD